MNRTMLKLLIAMVVMVPLLLMPATASAAPSAQGWGQVIHIVQWGENLTWIAARYGTTVNAIVRANGIRNPDYIWVGQRLIIPVPAPPPPPPPRGCTYVVRPGDTLYAIAWRYGTTIWWLASVNNLWNPNLIYAGQVLRVPCPPPPVKPKPTPTPIPAARCLRQVSITSPKPYEHVSGVLYIVGTANIPDFQFYKVEYGVGEKPLEWHSIRPVHREPISHSLLEVWDTDAFPEGVYTLRLTAVDIRGQFPQPCDVPIVIDRPDN